MRAIAIFEMDEKLFDELSNEKLSMRLLWDYDIMWEEKSKYFDHVILRPMPTKKVPIFDANNFDEERERSIMNEINGYNRCIDEIEGKENESNNS